MRPSDVGRRLSLHVQSPPPIALNIQVPAAPGVSSHATRRWSALKHCGHSLVPFPFKKVVLRIYSAARTMSARCFDADPDLAKQNAPRSNAPASPARQMCSDPNRILHVCEPDEFWLTRLYGVHPPKGTNVFFASFITTDKHHVHQQGAIVRSSRELSSKVSQRFFRGDSTLPRGLQNLRVCILTNPYDSQRACRILELPQKLATHR
jgi:hypothetical protein